MTLRISPFSTFSQLSELLLQKRRFSRIARLIVALSSLASCSLGPDYTRPELNTPPHFRLAANEAPSLANIKWWEQLGDAELNRCIGIALKENKDLGLASLRIEEFYAQLGIAGAPLYPQIDAAGDYERFRRSVRTKPSFGAITANQFDASLRFSWELDLWGRIRRLKEAANANLLAQHAARRGIILTLVSSVADTYVQLRQLDRQLEIARNTLQAREKSLNLITKRFQGGDTSELDLRQAEAEVAATRVIIPDLERQIAQTENRLSILMGRNPGQIDRGSSIDTVGLSAEVPAGLPSDLLEQRPDLIQAEEQLIAANAKIGAAKAELLPKLSLTGMFGFESAELSDWLQAPARAWQFSPGLNLPIFNANRLLDQVYVSEAQQKQAVLGYQKAVQDALREVEDSLIQFQKAGEQKEARRNQVSVLRRYFELATIRYEGGQSNYLDVLDAQRNLFNAETDYVTSEGNHIRGLIALYKALGGGWVVDAEKLLAEAQPSAK